MKIRKHSPKKSKALIMNLDNINFELIRNVVVFLYENEQYGDDWSEEISELEKILDAQD